MLTKEGPNLPQLRWDGDSVDSYRNQYYESLNMLKKLSEIKLKRCKETFKSKLLSYDVIGIISQRKNSVHPTKCISKLFLVGKR